MRTTYAVVWREGDEPIASGRLEIRARSVVFSGAGEDGAVEREVPLDSLRTVHIGRSAQDRLDGRASLVLVPRDGPLIRVAGVAQPGIVAELAQRLAGLQPAREPTGCFLVVLPLKEGVLARARELVAAGPPFDPAEAGLLRHQVFLLEHEAVFAFEAARDDERLHQLLGRPDLWAAAESWGELAAGPPSVAEGVYDWVRAAQAGTNGHVGTLSFEPTPGPGDSDGGDLYSP
jgi:hypothetical protein